MFSGIGVTFLTWRINWRKKPQKDESLVNDLIAFAVLEDDVSEESAWSALTEFAEKHFESYECPSKYIFIDELPRTTIGKVNYRALEKEAENL